MQLPLPLPHFPSITATATKPASATAWEACRLPLYAVFEKKEEGGYFLLFSTTKVRQRAFNVRGAHGHTADVDVAMTLM